MDPDEKNLLEGVRKGDPQAFQTFVERYNKQVYFLALSLTGSHHDAEDLSQEVFMKALSSIQGFRGESKTASWLHRITVNSYLDFKRKASLRILRTSEPLEGEEGRQIAATNPEQNPVKQLERQALRKAIDGALTRLSPRQRSVFVLRHYEDLTLKEIADVLSVREGTVKSCLFVAVRKLQKHLEKFHVRESAL